jgi:hypothetical protein
MANRSMTAISFFGPADAAGTRSGRRTTTRRPTVRHRRGSRQKGGPSPSATAGAWTRHQDAPLGGTLLRMSSRTIVSVVTLMTCGAPVTAADVRMSGHLRLSAGPAGHVGRQSGQPVAPGLVPKPVLTGGRECVRRRGKSLPRLLRHGKVSRPRAVDRRPDSRAGRDAAQKPRYEARRPHSQVDRVLPPARSRARWPMSDGR